MKTTILLFSIVLAFLSVTVSPQARAVCQEGCLTNNNTVLGDDALLNNTTGSDNTAIGFDALFSLRIGSGNTAIGGSALFNNTSGNSNTANGWAALFNNTTGNDNTANGYAALGFNTTGFSNTANGFEALGLNTTGFSNTAVGTQALYSNTSANGNTAIGYQALGVNTTGFNNTADGFQALYYNTTGNKNTAHGGASLYFNTTGFSNTADGWAALYNNTIGINNTANGHNALFGNTTGSNNIALGHSAGRALTTGDNNIDIGNSGFAAESGTIRIGTTGTQTATFIAGISGFAVPGGVGVIVGTNGKLGTVVSSERFKDAIKPMDKASEAILALKPVSFRYKKELDPAGIPQFGLVAEQVEKVNPDLVGRDADGKAYTVRYEAVNAMLLNEFLKEHRKVEEQGTMIARQQKQIEALTAGLQKVSTRLELSKSAPQTALKNQ
jgi:Chaperone of endosialidase